MLQITEQDKIDLEDLKRSRGFEVLKRIEKEANDELFSRLAKFNIDDEKDRETIKRYQVYQTAREDFFRNIDNYLVKIYEPSLTYKQE
jgi:hypothetical protein